MQYLTFFAIYFIIWWLTLFAMLPIGMRTQSEDNDVVNGTVKSAPARFRAFRVFLLTSVVAGLVFGCWYWLTQVMGIGPDSIPRIVPAF